MVPRDPRASRKCRDCGMCGLCVHGDGFDHLRIGGAGSLSLSAAGSALASGSLARLGWMDMGPPPPKPPAPPSPAKTPTRQKGKARRASGERASQERPPRQSL